MAEEAARAALRAGAADFDRGDWLAAHEAWEEYWLRIGGSEAAFFQGLIQLAVALHHAESDRPAPARKLLDRAIHRLRPFAPSHHGLDVTCLVNAVTKLRGLLAVSGQNRSPRAVLPPFTLPLLPDPA